MNRYWGLLVVSLVLLSLPVWGAADLPALSIRDNQLTVSGVSSGGYMAVQYHVAHSRQVMGAGILAGGPYGCAESGRWPTYQNCLMPDPDHPVPSTGASVARVERDAREGLIDDPVGMVGDRVWLLSGELDQRVDREVVDALAAFYRHWLEEGDIDYIKLAGAAHAMITGDADVEANECGESRAPYISHCPGIDPPGLLLAHLLGPLAPKAESARGELMAFDQGEFSREARALGLGDTGILYIPSGCRNGGCRLHVVFHGCHQSYEQVDLAFVRRAGYNRWAESNRIVVLYPQVAPRYGWTWSGRLWQWFEWVFNPNACWDWWGYGGDEYATKEGAQLRAVRLMVARLAARAGQ